MDTLSKKQRSERMARIRGRDTAPERLVRKIVWGLGFRYRLHQRDLPGCPDLVFRPQKKVVFVQGCFWHLHSCPIGRIPKSRRRYWLSKLTGNQRRDKRNFLKLKRLGWKVLAIWECQLENHVRAVNRLRGFLAE